jgi:glycosyltransferase involved in cell wall biosynthesis
MRVEPLPAQNSIRVPGVVPTLSAVVPMFNEEAVLPLFVQRLRPVLDGLGVDYEVLAVDDGSVDGTAVLLQRYHREWPQLRVVRLRANSGHQAAISAGLAAARGDYVVTLDADLQDPPEVIAEMMAAARREAVDVVYGVRNDRSTDSAFKRGSANVFYRVIRRLSGTGAPASAGDFRLMSRATVDAVNALPEHHRVLRLVVPAFNFPSATVEYRREERAAGSSKYSLRHMLRLALDSVTAFSIVPLRFATWLGLLGALCAFGVLAFAVIGEIVGSTVPGWASLVGAVSGFGAVQLVCIGLLGEYVGRIYIMQQGRPTYSVAYDSLLADGASERRTGPEPVQPAPAPQPVRQEA